MQVVLEVIGWPHRGNGFAFDGHDNFIVGRGRCAHFRLPEKDPFFSRVHFMIEINPPYCLLVDMGSTNGTRVNGRRVKAAYLGHGDLIQGGDTVLRVSLVGEADEPIGELPCPPPPPVEWMDAPMAAGARAEASQAVPPEMPAAPRPDPRPPTREAPQTRSPRTLEPTESFHPVPASASTGPPLDRPGFRRRSAGDPGLLHRRQVGPRRHGRGVPGNPRL